MTANFPSVRGLTWQGQGSSTCRMDSTDNLTNGVAGVRSFSDSDPGTLSNPDMGTVPDPFRSKWRAAVERGYALSPRHVCEIFEVSRGAVHNALSTGEMPGFRLGKLWRIRPEAIPARLIEYWVALKGLPSPPPPPLPTGELVYFISGMPNYVKIGFTTNLAKRIKALQIGCPEAIEVLAYRHGGRSLEHDYHMEFRAWRRAGEWFKLSQPVRAEIARLNTLTNGEPTDDRG